LSNKLNNNITNEKNLDANNQVFALGCRLNFFEAELLKKQVNLSGLKNTIIVNTCTVTSQAHSQSMQLIRKLKKNNPNSQIIITGCGAQIDSKKFAQMPEVNKVIGNDHKFSIDALLSDKKIVMENTNLDKDNYNIPQIEGFENHTRAFIQIQQGCDHKCSFCIINKARGASVSVSKEHIVEQIKKAVDFGHNEIVLTGVDISSYRRNIFNEDPSQIGALCKEILYEVKNLSRLRLSSLDPAVVDSNILDLLKNEPKFMPHLHLSLQSLNDVVLKNMGRRHNKESALQWINDIKKSNPKVVLGADFICGFPRESEDQFLDTLESIQQANLSFLHIFPYSPREGTSAYKMKNVDNNEIKRRTKLMLALGENLKLELFKSKLDSYVEVLVESKNMGYSQDYCLTQIMGDKIPKGSVVMAKVVDYNQKSLIAKI
jgi:threonylcarbamoyladenosine tRNA methylthiotransferase MtaB